ncbi:MAG: Lrp/AsnC family transcriptional regulator [Pseudomonadota bacterium]
MAEQDRTDISTETIQTELASRKPSSYTKRQHGLTSPDDELNQRIVRLLQDDGRRPFNEIAAALNVSEGTIRNRVNGMRQAGHMKIVAIVDPRAVEYRTDAIVCIRVSATATPSAVADRMSALDEVVYVLWVSGRFDLMVEIVTDEPDGLAQFLEAHIHNQPDIAETETMMGLKNFKNQFLLKQNWG